MSVKKPVGQPATNSEHDWRNHVEVDRLRRRPLISLLTPQKESWCKVSPYLLQRQIEMTEKTDVLKNALFDGLEY